MATKSFRNPTGSLTLLGGLIVLAYLVYAQPRGGLAVVGAVLVLGSYWLHRRHRQIWTDYRKQYRKSKNPLTEALNRPRLIYYRINVYVIIPLLAILGLVALYSAWKLV
jgi:hypothetical protein